MKNILPCRKHPTSAFTSTDTLQNLTRVVYFIPILFISLSTLSQTKPVTGRVVSGDSALVFATVQVKGTNVATHTDAGGNFAIEALPQDPLL